MPFRAAALKFGRIYQPRRNTHQNGIIRDSASLFWEHLAGRMCGFRLHLKAAFFQMSERHRHANRALLESMKKLNRFHVIVGDFNTLANEVFNLLVRSGFARLSGFGARIRRDTIQRCSTPVSGRFSQSLSDDKG